MAEHCKVAMEIRLWFSPNARHRKRPDEKILKHLRAARTGRDVWNRTGHVTFNGWRAVLQPDPDIHSKILQGKGPVTAADWRASDDCNKNYLWPEYRAERICRQSISWNALDTWLNINSKCCFCSRYPGCASLAGLESGLWSVEGGNWKVCKGLLEKSKAIVNKNTQVIEIIKKKLDEQQNALYFIRMRWLQPLALSTRARRISPNSSHITKGET